MSELTKMANEFSEITKSENDFSTKEKVGALTSNLKQVHHQIKNADLVFDYNSHHTVEEVLQLLEAAIRVMSTLA